MPENTLLEEKKRFVGLVGRLSDFDGVGADSDINREELLKEIIELGAYKLEAVDISYFNSLTRISEDVGSELIGLYLKERACVVTGDYGDAIKYRDEQTQILQEQGLTPIIYHPTVNKIERFKY